ncbi:MAG: hypothetical protein ACTSRL_03705 [Candidatus Helarchaeota archaeon]
MPKRKSYRRKKTGIDLLAAVLVALGAVICIIFGFLSLLRTPGIEEYAFGFIIQDFPIKEVLAIIFGIIIIIIEGFNKLNDYWSIIFIIILGIIAATLGALLIIIGGLLAIIQKVRRE